MCVTIPERGTKKAADWPPFFISGIRRLPEAAPIIKKPGSLPVASASSIVIIESDVLFRRVFSPNYAERRNSMPMQRKSGQSRWITAAILTAAIMAAYLVAGADSDRNIAMSNSKGEQNSSVEECSLK